MNNSTNNDKRFSHLMDSFAHLLKPIDIHSWRMNTFNPEEELEIWQCDHCGQDCAGESIFNLCADCEIREAERQRDEEDADNERELSRMNDYFDKSLND